ncbi:hypothetical protein N752_10990 [Desulforamulus aquiferis]|nr:4-alpha-glucanotransferase [Desulforamulus aquiferis]RYD05090.1 hypothetical protein N752_10990 [Desulforamulus aquiferis]
MKFQRQCGILLHPTSLPSKYGIGDFGTEAYDFVDFLSNSNQSLWQILPLNPVGYGESPFQCYSAFAGNPLLISIDKLMDEGLLSAQEISEIPQFNDKRVEFNSVRKYKFGLLKKAYEKFKNSMPSHGFERFIRDSHWLEDYALFMSLKDYYDGAAWNNWDKDVAFRKPKALDNYKVLLKEEILYHKFIQYQFFKQWQELRQYSNEREIRIVGDLPIFISYDSSDVWANPSLFKLDDRGNPITVAGVPPDYFSETGQLWGNPHYNWEVMERDGFKWWIDRFSSLLEMVDIIRIDHFRGFESYWEIPYGEETAINGEWVKAPGEKLFKAIKKSLGDIPVIAEDLGIITPEVEELKEKLDFPGMKVLHFILNSGEKELYLPHNFEQNCVVYTGTHDNDTTVGWYRRLLAVNLQEIEFLEEYLDLDNDMTLEDICWRVIEVAYESEADTVIIPLQDTLCLDSDARMNRPGTVGGNWDWRAPKNYHTSALVNKLIKLAKEHYRFLTPCHGRFS